MMDDEELKSCQQGNKEWLCPVPNCDKVLSRKQTLQNHLSSSHNIKAGNPSKRYKLYEVDGDTPLPKSTYYHRRKHEENQGPEIFTQEETPVAAPETRHDLAADPIESYSYEPSFQEDIDIEEELIENFVDSFGPPLYVIPPNQHSYRAPIPQYHHYMTLCAFANYHNLSDRGFKHLINLIGLHLPKENLMETNIDTLKEICGFEDSFLKQHVYCPICKKLFTGEAICRTPGCQGTKEKNTTSYFVTGSMQVQLKEILEREGIWTAIQDYASNRPDHTNISDVVDGIEYRKLKQEHGFLADKNNLTLSLFTDGIPLFQSSKVSLWPVYLLINELPPKQRFTRKNMVLWGIWQGCGKPQMNMFLRPLVEDLATLYHSGIDISLEGKPTVNSKAMMVIATMDLQARAYVMQMTQHNGEYGCLYCYEPGCVVKSGKGNCRVFPYRETVVEQRSKQTIKEDAHLAIRDGRKVRGIVSESVLSCLPYFDPTVNILIDYMHGILLGILKRLMKLWFDGTSKTQPYYIGDKVEDIDKLMKKIKPPYYLRRLPRTVNNNYTHWKASEFRSWLLYYSLPVLQDSLPELYLCHYSLLVEATTILLGEGITEDDLTRAHQLLLVFVKNANLLYGENIVGLNFHNLTHLTKCVRMWGPLWAWSCFVFESFNGEIKKAVHGTGNACRQIFWSLQCQKKVETLSIKCQNVDPELKQFYQSMTEGSNVRQKGGEDAFQCTIYTPTKVQELPNDVVQQLVTLTRDDNLGNYKLVKKISRNGYMMFSRQCSRVMKRNSYTIKFVDNRVAEIKYFLLHQENKRVFAICQMLQPSGPLMRGRVPHLQSFRPLRNTVESTVVKAELLQEPVVVIQTKTKICCGVIPNNVERD